MNGTLTTLGEWHGEATSVSAVEAAIADLRRQESKAAVRTAVLTLVAVVEQGDCEAARDLVLELGMRHPSHAVLLVTGDATGAPAINADVRVHLLEGEEQRALCFEDVVLSVQGPAVDHIDSIIEPFVLPDLPCVAWFPYRLPNLSDSALGAADRVILDSRLLDDPRHYADVAALARHFPLADLSWVRLEPWRELLAGLFEGATFRPFVHQVRSVTVKGKPGPRRLLAGWLASRLGLNRSQVHLEDAAHVTMEVHAEVDGHGGHFVVSRPTDERIIEATAAIDGGPSHSRTLRMRDRSPARVLGQALARLHHDDVYDEALAAAVDL